MRLLHLALVATVAVVLSACSGGPGSSAPVSAAPSSAGTSAASGSAVEVTVKLTDVLKMEPATFTAKVGVPMRFVVTNSGATDHEFYLGDEAAQMAHEKEMAGMPGMGQDEPGGVGLKAGETKTVEYTFRNAGTFLAGCHVNGHYAAGMMAAITVTD